MKPKVYVGIGSGWVTFLKTVAFIFSAIITVLGIVLGNDSFWDAGWLIGGLIGLGIGLLTISASMILLNAAENIEQTTTNSAAIYTQIKTLTQVLEQLQKQVKQMSEASNSDNNIV